MEILNMYQNEVIEKWRKAPFKFLFKKRRLNKIKYKFYQKYKSDIFNEMEKEIEKRIKENINDIR